MSTTSTTELPQDLVDRALQLPPDGRAKLGQLLLNSVSEHDTPARELIRSRVADLVSGKAELLAAEDVFRMMDERLAEMRRQ